MLLDEFVWTKLLSIFAGGMQDYNYLAVGTFELTLELSCCKYPYAAELPRFWELNKDALINFLFEAHIGLYGFGFFLRDTTCCLG